MKKTRKQMLCAKRERVLVVRLVGEVAAAGSLRWGGRGWGGDAVIQVHIATYSKQ